MIIVAIASGTSADGLDVAAVDLSWDGSVIRAQLLDHTTEEWPAGLGSLVLSVLPPARTTAAALCAIDTRVGQAAAAAARRMVDRFSEAELVVSPGQTVHHEVLDGQCLGTLQLGQPAWVAEATGLPVVSDLRARDVTVGGQGAPLASTLDALWLAGDVRRAALNLGGIANVTVVGSGEPAAEAGGVLSWDTGPANCLLDVAAARVTAGMHGCDEDGRLALAGQVRDDLLDLLLSHPYYRLTPPVSTGRETFSAAYLGEVLAAVDLVGPDDLLATLTELTAETVARALAAYAPAEVIASGGGTRNPALMAALRRALDRSCSGARLVTSDEAGLPAQAKEALLWALLGFLTWHGVPGTNGATGSRLPRILGRISPGHGPLVMPAPVGLTPTRLVLS